MSVLNSFLDDQIQETQTLIAAYNAAELKTVEGGIVEYWIDTGQTSDKVKKFTLKEYRAAMQSLYNQLETLCARRSGGGIMSVPAW
jgi:hypothetical protein